jgi:biotin transport system substrate-specific component
MRKKIGNREIALCGLFAALIAVGAFIKIPGPIVPFTAQVLFVNLAGILLGKREGALAVGVYIALGLIGVPIFTEGGGIGYVLNPKFGYLIGFFVGAYAAGAVFERLKGKYDFENLRRKNETDNRTDKIKSFFYRIKNSELPPYLIAGLVNIFTIYFFGVIYYYLVARFYLGSANGLWFFVVNCFLVFVPTDLIWCVVSAFIAKRLLPFIKNAAFTSKRPPFAAKNAAYHSGKASEARENDRVKFKDEPLNSQRENSEFKENDQAKFKDEQLNSQKESGELQQFSVMENTGFKENE